MNRSEPLQLQNYSLPTPNQKNLYCERQAGLMVSRLNSALKGVSSRPVKGDCVVFLGKII